MCSHSKIPKPRGNNIWRKKIRKKSKLLPGGMSEGAKKLEDNRKRKQDKKQKDRQLAKKRADEEARDSTVSTGDTEETPFEQQASHSMLSDG